MPKSKQEGQTNKGLIFAAIITAVGSVVAGSLILFQNQPTQLPSVIVNNTINVNGNNTLTNATNVASQTTPLVFTPEPSKVAVPTGIPSEQPTTVPVPTELIATLPPKQVVLPTEANTPSSPNVVKTLIAKGNVTINRDGTRLVSLSTDEVIIGTADKYQDLLQERLPPFTVFVIYGPIESNLSLWYGGWDAWENATLEFVEGQMTTKVEEIKRIHPTDYKTRGIRVLRCQGSVDNCKKTVVVPGT